MFQFSTCRPGARKRLRLGRVQLLLPLAGWVWLAGGGTCVSDETRFANPSPPRRHFATNVAQLRSLTGADYLSGCAFRLNGVVTLVDTNRDLLVLQDAMGAVALNFRLKDHALTALQLVTLVAENCCPYFSSVPDYPFRPAGADVLGAFEAPENWGEYHLTRLRGFLRPPRTGSYTFWIASDNSSELWLSINTDPSKARKLASIERFQWVSPREWSKFPSQRSDPIELKAGEAYYVEALAEQNVLGENLAVAWQGPGLSQGIIESTYLTPWRTTGEVTNGVLREYWTNYSAGDLDGLTGPRAFESALTVEHVQVVSVNAGDLPTALTISLNRPLPPEDNFRWVQVEGDVKFTSVAGDMTLLELTDGQAIVQVRVSGLDDDARQRFRNVRVRVEGVVEGVMSQTGLLMPSVIWSPSRRSVSVLETVTHTTAPLPLDSSPQSTNAANPPMQGFYGTRGVVTFNDQVLGTNYVFVQENAGAVRVALENPSLKNQLKVGHWVDLGGALAPGRFLPVLTPLIVRELGEHPMPRPIAPSPGLVGNEEGRWSELEGVVHAVNTNGTLLLVNQERQAHLWVGNLDPGQLARYVDARLRARGVLLLSLLASPTLLVPSCGFVDVLEPPPDDPFAIPRHSVAALLATYFEAPPHRVRVVGEVTFRDAQSFFLQDASGGIRVRTDGLPPLPIGQAVEVIGFPARNGPARELTQAVVRRVPTNQPVASVRLDLGDAFSSEQSGRLVYANPVLLAQKSTSLGQVLELQEQQRVFVATLALGAGSLPKIEPGSRLRITGICDNEPTAAAAAGDKPGRPQLLSSLRILLRQPADVIVIAGPPWWTLKRTLTLVGTLLGVIMVTLLWVHLLRRRLERQQAAQLAFSRQLLERLEDERRRIAVNLHDSLGQTLLVIKNHALLAMQRPTEEPEPRQRLGEISSATSQAIEEVRQITLGLRPYQLDRLGLTQAIRASIDRATADSPISFATRVEEIDGLFDADAEIHVYRIVQEGVTNVVKHSGATEAAVVIKKRDATISLSIRDNGRGFDAAKLSVEPHHLGYGLSGIAERARILGATFSADSRPSEGANLTIEIPLPIRKHDPGSNHSDRG